MVASLRIGVIGMNLFGICQFWFFCRIIMQLLRFKFHIQGLAITLFCLEASR
ncbi:hypothetical protein OIU77_027463 [Salix suchowensis]|uniref:Uncharacterized protein n=1 Tax=Salix suchowensis TaxID=1278906 RepID=A0ABQ9BSZ6_9ROSI|nr:hypothetical protein OIU77_027463 [Salix suchowensis]